MCSRYFVDLSPELRPFIEEARSSRLADRMIHRFGRPVIQEGEVKPTDIAPVIAPNARGIRSAFPMIWGFSAPEDPNTRRSRPLINCRVETAASKQMWRESWQRRRCVVPASWYYEWEHFTRPDGSRRTGDKFAIQPAGSSVCYLAGLYRIEEGFPHFTILTRTPSEALQKIHDRMPVILPSHCIGEWIDPSSAPEAVREIAALSLTDMVFERA